MLVTLEHDLFRKPVPIFRDHAQMSDSGRLTSDPNRSSLGLLPSGPDPVGEWLVHRQPPAAYIGPTRRERKLRAFHRGAFHAFRSIDPALAAGAGTLHHNRLHATVESPPAGAHPCLLSTSAPSRGSVTPWTRSSVRASGGATRNFWPRSPAAAMRAPMSCAASSWCSGKARPGTILCSPWCRRRPWPGFRKWYSSAPSG